MAEGKATKETIVKALVALCQEKIMTKSLFKISVKRPA